MGLIKRKERMEGEGGREGGTEEGRNGGREERRNGGRGKRGREGERN